MKEWSVTHKVNNKSGYAVQVAAKNSMDARKIAQGKAESMHPGAKITILSPVEIKNNK